MVPTISGPFGTYTALGPRSRTLKRWAILASPFGRNIVLATFCLARLVTPARGGTAEDFPYAIQPELGATEFAAGDAIVITVFRGDRQHLEPGGHYLLEGTYTLASADSADLAWFSTSRGPSGSTPVAEDQHVATAKGTGTFRLKKTISEDGWLHVSFYVDNHSHGGVYFGEKGIENTVLRKKGWSDLKVIPRQKNPGKARRLLTNTQTTCQQRRIGPLWLIWATLSPPRLNWMRNIRRQTF